MLTLRDGLVELYKNVATSLPTDVEAALKAGHALEKDGSNAKQALSIVLENINLARKTSRPICQDTGVPVLYVKAPRSLSRKEIESSIIAATKIATEQVPLRANAVDILTDRNTGDNTGTGFPIIYFEESQNTTLTVELSLKGSGCENQGQIYRLPVEKLGAERDLEGVRKCVLDAVLRAQGRGCPPYTLGIGVGAAKDQVTKLSKDQIRRKLHTRNDNETLAALEERLLEDINRLGIGPLGLGGSTTAIGVKIGVNHRHPASYFVDVSVCCWANRRGTLIW